MKITRSFSKKIQFRPFEPIDSFCSAEMEVGDDGMNVKEEVSAFLDEFVRTEVGKTLEKLRPSLIKESGQDKLKVADVSVDEAENDTE